MIRRNMRAETLGNFKRIIFIVEVLKSMIKSLQKYFSNNPVFKKTVFLKCINKILEK